jgi:tyramine---L-glutamate ligase
MRIFVYEHITGGGCLDEALPPALAREGDLMLQALLDDLRDLAGTEVLIMRDPRLPATGAAIQVLRPRSKAEAQSMFRRCCASADAVWPIAPESGGVLERLTIEVLDGERILLGSRPGALRIAASKMVTARTLAAAGVPVVPTYSNPAQLPAELEQVVIKPDDGAGCQRTRIYSRAAALDWWSDNHPDDCVVQPYLRGDPLSLSLLCDGQAVQLLSCNRQRITIADGEFRFTGVDVNAVHNNLSGYTELAVQIAAAIPGLWGYVGVDLIETQRGPAVVDVNPRLTTSYAGLRRALARNPAALVLALLGSEPVIYQSLSVTAVKVAASHA